MYIRLVDYSSPCIKESHLVKMALEKYLLDGEDIILDLSGYNRYTKSYLKEVLSVFEGIYVGQLKGRLKITHDWLESIPMLCWYILEETYKNSAADKRGECL